ncbi:lipid-binding SYLF domain-containing protein [Paraburkholderia acidiphila]|uniref:hypothetical protein n=1 Tax=Paraburkholderia acidiphila TaxID=2571747 RepID=UPI001E3E21E6|nr:hypothetical protein [Paraburkholderia acidiphila]
MLGYYNVSALSYGLQAGAQNFSEAMSLMTPGAKQYLDSSDVYAFVFGQTGLMAGLGVQGQKITKLTE